MKPSSLINRLLSMSVILSPLQASDTDPELGIISKKHSDNFKALGSRRAVLGLTKGSGIVPLVEPQAESENEGSDSDLPDCEESRTAKQRVVSTESGFLGEEGLGEDGSESKESRFTHHDSNPRGRLGEVVKRVRFPQEILPGAPRREVARVLSYWREGSRESLVLMYTMDPRSVPGTACLALGRKGGRNRDLHRRDPDIFRLFDGRDQAGAGQRGFGLRYTGDPVDVPKLASISHRSQWAEHTSPGRAQGLVPSPGRRVVWRLVGGRFVKENGNQPPPSPSLSLVLSWQMERSRGSTGGVSRSPSGDQGFFAQCWAGRWDRFGRAVPASLALHPFRGWMGMPVEPRMLAISASAQGDREAVDCPGTPSAGDGAQTQVAGDNQQRAKGFTCTFFPGDRSFPRVLGFEDQPSELHPTTRLGGSGKWGGHWGVFGPRKKNLSVLGLEEEEVAAEVEEEEVEELFIEDMPPRTIIPFVRNDSDEESEVEDSGNLSPAIPPGSQEVGEETPN